MPIMDIGVNSNRPLNTGQKIGAGAGGAITALAGAFPTPSNQNSTQIYNTGQQTVSSQNNYSAADINSLLQTLSNLQTNTQQTATSTPTLSPQAQAFLSQLTQKYSNLAGQGTNLAPYQAQQTQGINQRSQAQQQAVDSIMAARGLSASPAAGTAQANIQANRVGQITNLAEQIPQLQHQLALENLNAAGGFFSQIPRGVTTGTQGTTSQIGDTSQIGKTTSVNTSDTNAQSNVTGQGTNVNRVQGSQGGGIGGFLASLGPTLTALLPLLLA